MGINEKKLECDFLVCGAGFAGICAAVQAGRLGMKTILLEKSLQLGGNGGTNLGVGATGALTTNPYWHETGIIEELELRVGWNYAKTHPTNFGYSIAPLWDTVVYDMLLEAGVQVLNGHLAYETECENDRIKNVLALNTETLEKVRIHTRFCVDDTGDAMIARLAGADCTKGRESRAVTGERSAPEKADEVLSAASITALVADMGEPSEFIAPDGTPQWNPDKPCNHFDPSKKLHFIWQVDEGGEDSRNNSLDTPQELYRKLRYRIYSTWDYLKNKKYPEELKNHALVWISPILGKREGYRILGDYMLTQKDIEEQRSFPDAAGFGGHFLDEHLPSYDGGYEVRFYNRPYPFEIPLRCLYSGNIGNLFSAGRAVGVSHQAFTSVRLMRTGGMLGQAVAVAGKMCMEKNCLPREIAEKYSSEFRQNLIRNDLWTLGSQDLFEENAVCGAKVTASSYASLNQEQEPGEAVSAENGIGTFLYSYPEQITELTFQVKNPLPYPTSVQIQVGYAQTQPVRLLEVPEVIYNREKSCYEESRESKSAVQEDHMEAKPDGKAGFSNYFLRNDVPQIQEVFQELCENVPAGYHGPVTFSFHSPQKLKSYDRKIFGQAVSIWIQGQVEVYQRARPLDICEGYIVENGKKVLKGAQLLFACQPDISYGHPDKLMDGFIHREGMADIHQWRSCSGQKLPQWIEFSLEKEQSVKMIQLYFDTTEKRYWSENYITNTKANPHLPAEYDIEILEGGEWKIAHQERNNYLRFRKHAFSCHRLIQGVRITIRKVWGEEEPARIYQIGLYS